MHTSLQKTSGVAENILLLPTSYDRKLKIQLQSTLEHHARLYSKFSNVVLESSEFDGLLIVLGGWLALSKSLAEGQNQIIDFAFPGDIVTPVSADGTTASVTVEAITDARIATIPSPLWERLLQDWPELHHLVDHITAAHDARRSERMLRLGKGSAETRVAYALLEFCVRLAAIDEAHDCTFHIPITQQQIGDFMGLSSVHVCRTMRRMARNNVLTITNHMDIHVTDPDALADMAGVSADLLRKEIIPQAG